MTIFEKFFNKSISIILPLIINFLAIFYKYNYRRFFVLETVARIPYFSYLSVLHLYQSLGAKPSIDLLSLHFQESINETYHLRIIEDLGGGSNILDKVFARTLGIVYYWLVVILYLIAPRSGYYLMELVESEAVLSYNKFLIKNKKQLTKQPITEIAKEYYFGDFRMEPKEQNTKKNVTMYDVFVAIRNDEKIHTQDMNKSIENYSSYFV
ncbi:plastoquinol terminal oxidase [bacterium]|nr:plastoquinol terminal oxidase [bacterium]